jgi:ATP-dependent exoDNAse (exonuclease V) alpha subunit
LSQRISALKVPSAAHSDGFCLDIFPDRLFVGERLAIRDEQHRLRDEIDGKRHLSKLKGMLDFDHGYAVTSHSAQELTAESVLIHADTSVHPDLLSSRFGYVAVSRASHEAVIFTDDVTRLAQHLGTEVTKTAALEINQFVSLCQGLEMN